MAEAPGSQFRRQLLHQEPGWRARSRNDLRECALPEPLGMLVAADGHVHDSRRDLHPTLRVLRGERGKPEAVLADEPDRLAEACLRLELRHVVITSVTRDDLEDEGAEHFRRCILAVRQRTGATIEVLTPDFSGRPECIDRVVSARPEVFNHNLETVSRLQQRVSARASTPSAWKCSAT